MLVPRKVWADAKAFEATSRKLAALFQENFAHYADLASDEIKAAGPKVAAQATS